MDNHGNQFWFLVRDAALSDSVKHQALYHALTPIDGVILTNDRGFPVGVPLRRVAAKLAELGYCNGKGNPYHPEQVQQFIYDAFPDAFARFEKLDLSDEQRAILRQMYIEGTRQKCRYEQMTEEERCRESWRLLKRPVKRPRPWDNDGE